LAGSETSVKREQVVLAMTAAPSVGCPQCFQAAPETVWQSRRAFRQVAEVIAESHFHVLVLECPACGQRSVSIFSEAIDWANGDDAQFWRLAPLTVEESQRLIAGGGRTCIPAIMAMASDRRHLAVDHPTERECTFAWSAFLFIEPHS
jgi:hypothetical protein